MYITLYNENRCRCQRNVTRDMFSSQELNSTLILAHRPHFSESMKDDIYLMFRYIRGSFIQVTNDVPGFGGHNRLTRIHLDAFNVLIREQPTTIGLLRFINPDPTTWPCGEMASRLTTTQCDQEIAGSTPVSVIPFFIFSYLHSRKYSYPELFFLSIPLVIGLMSNWNVQRYSKAYVCIGSVIITVDLFNLTSQYVRFAMASSI